MIFHSPMTPSIPILDAHHHLSTSMAAISLRTCRVLAPSLSKLPAGFRRATATASFRPCVHLASSSSSYSLRTFLPCRASSNVVEQESSCSGNDFVPDNVGAIHVITGPMFAGKTTALLKRITTEADAGRYCHSPHQSTSIKNWH